jgi:hypothetical protein
MFTNKYVRKVGQTSNILAVWIEDSASAGSGKTTLAFNSGSLTCYYKRDVGTASVAVSLATMTLGTFASGGFKEIDATNMPGWYEFCPPDAALASGAKSVTFHFNGAAGMFDAVLEIDLNLCEVVTTEALTEAYAADGAAGTLAQMLYLMQQGLVEFSVSGTTITIKKLDGSTTAATCTMDSATAPTSRTRAS